MLFVVAMIYSVFLAVVGFIEGIFIQFLIPFLIIGATLGLSLLLPQPIKSKLGISLLTVGLTLLTLETSLEVLDRVNTSPTQKTIPEYVQDIRDQNTSAYPTTNIGSYLESFPEQVFPLAGISDTFSVFCSTKDDLITYISDEHGFNNPKNIWGLPSIQLISIGDSFTHGECVNSDLNIGTQLRKQYTNSLNLGWAGTGPLTQYAVIREYVKPITPEVVLWFYYEGNDLTDLISEQTRFPILKQYPEDISFTQNLMENQNSIDEQLTNYVDYHMSELPRIKREKSASDFEEAKLLNGLTDIVTFRNLSLRIHRSIPLIRTNNRVPLPTVTDQTISTFSQLLESSENQISSWNGKLFFIYLPSYGRYAKQPLNTIHDNGTKYHSKVLAEVKNLAIPIIDISETFDSHPDPLSLWPDRMDGHYNGSGYRLVAKTVLDAIEHQSQD